MGIERVLATVARGEIFEELNCRSAASAQTRDAQTRAEYVV
jgi:hypothetical protein